MLFNDELTRWKYAFEIKVFSVGTLSVAWWKYYEFIAFTITFDLYDKSYVYCISSHVPHKKLITQQASSLFMFTLKLIPSPDSSENPTEPTFGDVDYSI
jgi:hypothetical protein